MFSKLRVSYCLFVVLMAIVVSCKQNIINDEARTDYQTMIAKADGGFTYNMQQLFGALDQSHLVPDGGYVSSDSVLYFLDSLLCDTLAGLEAMNIDLGEYPDYRAMFRLRYYDILLRQYMDQEIYSRLDLDSSDVVDYYYAHPELYSKPDRVHIYHILASPVSMRAGADSLRVRGLKPEALAMEVSEYIQNIYRELEKGRDFRKVALEYSHDQMISRDSGDVGWIDRGVIEDPFDSIAFSMRIGTYSKPYEDKNGWHIIYKVDFAEAGLPEPTFEMLQKAGRRLQGEKADEIAKPLLDSLEKEINLVINEQLLDTNYYYVNKWEWVAILNGIDTFQVYDVLGLEEPFRKRHRVDNTTEQMKREMIYLTARRMVLIQAANAISIDTLPSVREQRELLYTKYAKAVVLLERSDPGWYPSDDDIQLYFQKNYLKNEVKQPLKVQHIVCEDSVLADFISDQAQSGVDFLTLAEQYYPGDKVLRKRMADLGNVSQHDVASEFFDAAMATPEGKVTDPVRTEYGWEIIKVLVKREAQSLGTYRSKIVSKLRAKHSRSVFESFRDRLFRKYHLRYTYRIPSVTLKPRLERTS